MKPIFARSWVPTDVLVRTQAFCGVTKCIQFNQLPPFTRDVLHFDIKQSRKNVYLHAWPRRWSWWTIPEDTNLKFNSSLASQETPPISTNPKVHRRTQKQPSTGPYSEFNLSHNISSRSFLILFSHTCPGLPSRLLTWYFPTKTFYSSVLSLCFPYFPHVSPSLIS